MPKTMWAQRLIAPFRYELEEATAPTADDLAPGQVLLRLLVAGVCGSDLPFFKGTVTPRATREGGRYRNPPGTPVHEIVGEVLASTTDDLRPGARAVGWASDANGLAEYVIADAAGLATYDERLKPAEAVMVQPLACVMYAVDQLGPLAGVRTAVIGQGPIGLLFSHVLKSGGASHVTGVDRVDRGDVAGTFGVDECVFAASSQWVAETAEQADPPTLVVEAVGHQTTTLADGVGALGSNGHLYYFGIPDQDVYPLPMYGFLRKNLRMSAGVTPAEHKKRSLVMANDYLARYPELIGPYITNVHTVDEATEAFRLATEPRPGQVKIVLTAQS